MSSLPSEKWGERANDPSQRPRLITRVADIPPGLLDETLLPDEWRSRFAVLHEKDQRLITVLVTPEAYGGAPMFDLRRRLLGRFPRPPQFLQATSEIIKLVRDQRVIRDPIGLAATTDATAIENFSRQLIETALDQRASDIHLETRSDHASLYFRIDGIRHLHCHISIESARSLGIVLYSVHADASSKDVVWDPTQVMDAVIEHRRPSGQPIQMRFSSAPIFPTGNFHLVIRLLRMDVSTVELEDLGYSTLQQATLERLIAGLSGMVLLCGPTNSGKSTTLQALMRRLYHRLGDSVKMITVEDPVEYVLPGACQISIARRQRQNSALSTAGLFTQFLRGTLRQDPDIVMIGEIRDHESASIAKDLVLAGRKLLTTLHTYSALWAFVRLRELGLPLELLTMPGFISGIVYQRLVPVLCPHCSVPLENGIRIRGPGCEHCEGRGVLGRTVCAELVVPDSELLELIAAQNYRGAEKYWLSQPPMAYDLDHEGITVLDHGVYKMKQGRIAPQDLESHVGLLDTSPRAQRQ